MTLKETEPRTNSLPKFPRLIFLDTNVVQNLHSFWELIFERSISPKSEDRLNSRGYDFAEDIYALSDFMSLGLRIGWPLAVSPRTLEELKATSHPYKRAKLVAWGGSLADHYLTTYREQHLESGAEHSSWGTKEPFTVTQRDYLAKLLEDIPQESDRQLIIDALEFECDIFLTMDYRRSGGGARPPISSTSRL